MPLVLSAGKTVGDEERGKNAAGPKGENTYNYCFAREDVWPVQNAGKHEVLPIAKK